MIKKIQFIFDENKNIFNDIEYGGEFFLSNELINFLCKNKEIEKPHKINIIFGTYLLKEESINKKNYDIILRPINNNSNSILLLRDPDSEFIVENSDYKLINSMIIAIHQGQDILFNFGEDTIFNMYIDVKTED